MNKDLIRLLAKQYGCGVCAFNRDGLTCTAFPNGIPSEILQGEVPHFEPYGDESITFSFSEARAKALVGPDLWTLLKSEPE